MLSVSHQFNFQWISFSLSSRPLELDADPHLSTPLFNLVTVGKDFFALWYFRVFP